MVKKNIIIFFLFFFIPILSMANLSHSKRFVSVFETTVSGNYRYIHLSVDGEITYFRLNSLFNIIEFSRGSLEKKRYLNWESTLKEEIFINKEILLDYKTNDSNEIIEDVYLTISSGKQFQIIHKNLIPKGTNNLIQDIFTYAASLESRKHEKPVLIFLPDIQKKSVDTNAATIDIASHPTFSNWVFKYPVGTYSSLPNLAWEKIVNTKSLLPYALINLNGQSRFLLLAR